MMEAGHAATGDIAVPELTPARVHLWTADVAQGSPVSGSGEPLSRSILSASEIDRADRFRSGSDAERYIATHVILRKILARYTGLDPSSIVIGRSPEGKPHLSVETLAVDPVSFGLSFSISCSGGIFLCGVTSGAAAGVDIQVHDGIELSRANAGLFMPEDEMERFLSLPAPEKKDMFFSSWARREAVVKACGKGLTEDPCSIRIEAAGSARGKWKAHLPSSALEWNVFDIPLREGYSAAVAVEGDCKHVELLDFNRCYRPV